MKTSGGTVHLWTTSHDFEVGPTIEGFEAEGWTLAAFTTHFRDFRAGVVLASAADVVIGRQRRNKGSGSSWQSITDVYNLLFRYGGKPST